MIAVLGEYGFVGKKVCEVFSELGIEFLGVNRNTFSQATENNNFSTIINCAMPSGRFFANNNPLKDFSETVYKTASVKYYFPRSKIVQISSISASVQVNTIYGKHKKLAEEILAEDDLIIRLGPLYDKSLSKGALIDIINNRTVYVSGKSLYGFTPLNWVCNFIGKNLHQTGIIELGASGSVCLQELADILGSKSEFVGFRDDQIFEGIFDDQPHATDVIAFCNSLLEGQSP